MSHPQIRTTRAVREDERAQVISPSAEKARCQRSCATLALLISLLLLPAARAQQPAPDAPGAPASENTGEGNELSVAQAQLADRYKRLEEVVGRLAELSASTDPRRAKLLREAIARSREQDIDLRFESIVEFLEQERLSAASTNQTALQKELESLLTLLLKADRDREISSERDRIQKYLKELSGLIRSQKAVRARTQGNDDTEQLSQDQSRLAERTGELSGNISDSQKQNSNTDGASDAQEESESSPSDSPDSGAEDSTPKKKEGSPSESDGGDDPKGNSGAQSQPGEPAKESPSGESQSPPASGSDGSPQSNGDGEPSEGGEPSEPTDRAGERLRNAQQQMEEARKQLEQAQREGATERQREALKELELAKAELERVLRQLREEEIERTLTQLATRFRRMLEIQTAIYEGTLRLDTVPESERDHDDEIEAARLSRDEAGLVYEADKALLLLREEGSSVAFPEAVQQMRHDMQQVTDRLAQAKVGVITQGLEEDVLAALEETVAALEKAKKDLEKKRSPAGKQAAAQQTDQPLVDQLAELKMIRSLQMRIYNRTKRYGEMIEGEQAETAELLEALDALSTRQQRVYRATAELQKSANQ